MSKIKEVPIKPKRNTDKILVLTAVTFIGKDEGDCYADIQENIVDNDNVYANFLAIPNDQTK